jgi:hypothetical protein
MLDLQKACCDTVYPANSKSAIIIGPEAMPTAYVTFAVFPVSCALGTEVAPTHKSELRLCVGFETRY